MIADKIKKDFPLLMGRLENDKPIAYLDNAATTQKPHCVIDAVSRYYASSNANPHRGAYDLSAEATNLYEGARTRVAEFIGASSNDDIVFTRNATDSLNLVALSYGGAVIEPGDEILISISEHHSNLLPWQALARRNKAVLKYLYTDNIGLISIDEVSSKLSDRTKIVAFAQISNVLGVENPVVEITRLAHERGAVVVLDGAQSVPHIPVNVQELDVDFMAFSGHKMLGPDGIGVLYGKGKHFSEMEPPNLGGGIVEEVTEQTVRLLPAPYKFEPGTPNVEGAVGLHAAIDYLESIGMTNIQTAEQELTGYLLERLATVWDIVLYGDKQSGKGRTGIVSFNLADIHPHDVASILDADGVTIRAGHHCAQPLMGHLGTHSCCRASLYIYNTRDDVDRLVESLGKVRGWLTCGSRSSVH